MKRRTPEQFVAEVKEMYGDEYTVLSEYKHSLEKVKMRHSVSRCGYEWYVLPSTILRGGRCRKCFGNMRKTDEEFKREVYELVGDEYRFLEKYQKSKTKILVEHRVKGCGYKYRVTPGDFLSGTRCPKCSVKEVPMKRRTGARKLTNSEFLARVKEETGEEYFFKEEYQDTDTKLKVTHQICGNLYEVTPYKFLNRGQRCPLCRTSRGESKVEAKLKELEVKFYKEYPVKIDGRLFRFDFYLPKYRSAIEYDGEQHFISNKYFDSRQPFEKRKENDVIKNNYCHNRGIELLRIPYWQFDDIPEIVTEFINELESKGGRINGE